MEYLKAILVISVPGSCADCRLSWLSERRSRKEKILERQCLFGDVRKYDNVRAPFCPLKIVTESEGGE